MNKDKLGETLTRYLKNPELSPNEEIPVIITMRDVTEDLSFLEEKGFLVKFQYHAINAAAGTATADKIEDIAELDRVEKIEFDGEVTHF